MDRNKLTTNALWQSHVKFLAKLPFLSSIGYSRTLLSSPRGMRFETRESEHAQDLCLVGNIAQGML